MNDNIEEQIEKELFEEAEQWEKGVFEKIKSFFKTCLLTMAIMYILWHGVAIKIGHFEFYTIGFKFTFK